jgi:hypothetical protein
MAAHTGAAIDGMPQRGIYIAVAGMQNDMFLGASFPWCGDQFLSKSIEFITMDKLPRPQTFLFSLIAPGSTTTKYIGMHLIT